MDLDVEHPGESSRTDLKPPKYELFAFISHKGTSAHCGHYVAFVKKNNIWCLFNDNKVAEIQDIQNHIGEGYVYFYKQI
jgi:ubiquitin carboxyl-terminal hydrolase 5/13